MMWIVHLRSFGPSEKAWGPFDNEPFARRFAEFVSAEIDPAVVIPLTLPTWELLAWRDHVQGRDELKAAADQLVANALLVDADVYPAPKTVRTDLTTKAAADAPATADHQPNQA